MTLKQMQKKITQNFKTFKINIDHGEGWVTHSNTR